MQKLRSLMSIIHKLTVKLDWLIQHNASVHLIARRDVIWVYRKCFIHDDFIWKCREIDADFNWFLLSIWHNFVARWWRRVIDSVACGRHIFCHHHPHKNATDICYRAYKMGNASHLNYCKVKSSVVCSNEIGESAAYIDPSLHPLCILRLLLGQSPTGCWILILAT